MKKRDAIYMALLVFVAAGMLVDWYFWPQGVLDLTLNDIVQMVGIVLLVSWWQIEDARGRGASVSGVAKWMTVMLAPVGSAIYLVQSRGWGRAVPVFLTFWGGFVIAIVAGEFLGGWLVAGGFL